VLRHAAGASKPYAYLTFRVCAPLAIFECVMFVTQPALSSENAVLIVAKALVEPAPISCELPRGPRQEHASREFSQN
jgi:hypothetical protein